MTIVIKLMADYSQFPLWRSGGSFDNVGEINPASLPLTPELQAQLLRWHDRYYSQLNIQDFDQSVFFTDEERDEFDQEGIDLWQRLRSELAPTYEVWYFSERLQQVLMNPHELLSYVI